MKDSLVNAGMLVAKYIKNIFDNSNKKNLIITGSKQVGKSFLGNNLRVLFSCDFSIISLCERKKYVNLSFNGNIVEFAKYHSGDNLGMRLVDNADFIVTNAIKNAYNYNAIYIDEIGYLEENTINYQHELINLFNNLKVLAIIRKGDFKFLNSLKNRKDTLVIDLDEFILPIGCVIMASGISKRFGRNKHLAKLNNRYLIDYVIDIANNTNIKEKILLTRNNDTYNYCNDKINTILHNYELRSEATRLGVSNLENKDIFGIIFLQGDQPFIKYDTINNMILEFSKRSDCIIQARVNNTVTSPVIFPITMFEELKNLSGKSGGKGVINNHLDKVIYFDILEEESKDIDTLDDLNSLAIRS